MEISYVFYQHFCNDWPIGAKSANLLETFSETENGIVCITFHKYFLSYNVCPFTRKFSLFFRSGKTHNNQLSFIGCTLDHCYSNSLKEGFYKKGQVTLHHENKSV